MSGDLVLRAGKPAAPVARQVQLRTISPMKAAAKDCITL